jgi:hypothetical protein
MANALSNRNLYQGLYNSQITIKASVTVPSVATAAGTSVTVTVTGAAVGDQVDFAFPVAHGLVISAEVSAANTVKVHVRNDSGGTVNLGAQLVPIIVSKLNTSLFT